MHVAGAFSCLDLVDEIYHDLMKEGDTFIMSKGHGAMAQYVILEDQGKLNLDDYCRGPIGCHPDLHVPGIAAATGSLGHGLGIALGMAYAQPEHQVYCLLSDGEMQEGSTWEVLQVANAFAVTNLHIHIDDNGTNSSQKTFPFLGILHERLQHFNFLYHRIKVHKTTKGYPISYMMNNPLWHYRSPNPEEYQQALRELA
jgi:transketolase